MVLTSACSENVRRVFFLCFLGLSLGFGALGAEEVGDYETLLRGYIGGDAEAVRLGLEQERAALELRKYALDTGTAFTVNSGDTVFTFSPSGMTLSAEPGVELSFPNLRNTGLALSAPLSAQGGEVSRYGVDAKVSTEIITGRGDDYRAGLEESRRRFLTALRNAESRRRVAEKEFCAAVKELLTLENDILRAQDAALQARTDLETKRVSGYGASSVVWRTAELTLRTREREQEEARRKAGSALKDFAEACGVEAAAIPENIPEEELAAIAAFDPLGYTELEAASWTYSVNTLKRRAQDRPFTLNGNVGYSWRNDPPASSSGSLGAGGSSLSAGLGFTGGGLSFSAGVSAPLERPDEPSLTLRFQWKPSGSRVSSIDKQLRELTAQAELHAITEAEKKFRTVVSEYDRKRGELLWQQEAYGEELDLYRINEEEQRRWFDQGMISESNYLEARTNYLLALNRLLSARIDRKIYNLDLQGLFVERSGQ
jgi:hypothetical protein